MQSNCNPPLKTNLKQYSRKNLIFFEAKAAFSYLLLCHVTFIPHTRCNHVTVAKFLCLIEKGE